jgi:glycosyltransferase involved in cell wall biosynthesis
MPSLAAMVPVNSVCADHCRVVVPGIAAQLRRAREGSERTEGLVGGFTLPPRQISDPRVSVIIPAYNAAAYVAQAAESALAQTFAELEVIVVDDGSSDHTGEILAIYGDRIQYIRQDNRGPSAARNVAIAHARGEYLAFLDADDLWLPQKLERQVPLLDAQPDVALAYSLATIVDGDGRERQMGGRPQLVGQGQPQPTWMIAELIPGNCIPLLTAVARRREVESAGMFDERIAHSEDWDLWFRLSRLGPAVFLQEALAQYRVLSEARTAAVGASRLTVEQSLFVLDKAFSVAAELNAESKGPAIAQVYVRAALAALVLSNAEQGREYLERALGADATLPREARELAARALYRARVLAAERGMEEGRSYLEVFFASLPSAFGGIASLRRSVLGEYYVGALFEAHARRDVRAAKQALWPGLRSDPRWLASRGVWRAAWDAYRAPQKQS